MTLTCKVLAIVACGLGFYLGESGAVGAPPKGEKAQRLAQRLENATPQQRARIKAKLRKYAKHHRHHGAAHHRHQHGTKGGAGKQTPKAN